MNSNSTIGWNVKNYYSHGYIYFNNLTGQMRFLVPSNNGAGVILRTMPMTGNLPMLGRHPMDVMGFLDRAGTTFEVGGLIYTGLEKLTNNSKFWIDAKGQIRPTQLLERGPNGKYVHGVQGLRNSQATAARAAGIYKAAGRVIGFLGVGITAYDALSDGNLTLGEGVKIGIGIVTIFTPFGWAYTAVDVGISLFNNGNGLTNMIGDAIDNW